MGRSIFCSSCKKEKEIGRDNESCCRSCKAKRRSEAKAKKRAELGLPVWGKTERSSFCAMCGSPKENLESGYCNTCKRNAANNKRLLAKESPTFAQEERDKRRSRYRENEYYRLQVLARIWTKRAIKAGALLRQPCEVCGKIKVDAHHDDYAKPLEVRWLCKSHHNEHHRKHST